MNIMYYCKIKYFIIYLISHRWYFGDISQAEVDKMLLLSSNSTGAYLVRLNNGKFTLSVRNEKIVKHYRILSPNQKVFFLTQ